MKMLTLPERKGYQSSGITIEYGKGKDTLIIGGFFDAIAGIESTEITVSEFCKRLGIDLKRQRGG